MQNKSQYPVPNLWISQIYKLLCFMIKYYLSTQYFDRRLAKLQIVYYKRHKQHYSRWSPVWNITQFYIQPLWTYFFMTLPDSFLSYAKQTDIQKHKATSPLDTSTHYRWRFVLYFVWIRPAQIQQCQISKLPHRQYHLLLHRYNRHCPCK